MLSLRANSPDSIIPKVCNYSLSRFYTGCRLLSDGAVEKDVLKLSMALDSMNTNITKNGQELIMANLTVTPVDTTSTLNFDNCFEFTTDYCCELLERYGDDIFVERPSLLRNKGKASMCKTYTLRLKANCTAEYDISQRGNCQLIIMAEPLTRVMAEVTCALTEIPLQHFEDENVWFADWKMPAKGQIRLKLTNHSDVPSTIIILSN